jgi:hypothetical protein
VVPDEERSREYEHVRRKLEADARA